MLISKQDLLSDAQAITVDAISTNQRDFIPWGGAINAGDTGGPSKNTTVNLGGGTPLYLYVLVTTELDSAAHTTSLITTLESDVVATLNSAPVVHWTSGDIEEATLATGYWIAKGVPLPPGAYKRYVGLRYNVGAEENFTSGNITAWISATPYSNEQYESATLTGVN
jgi:hypothetical protein